MLCNNIILSVDLWKLTCARYSMSIRSFLVVGSIRLRGTTTSNSSVLFFGTLKKLLHRSVTTVTWFLVWLIFTKPKSRAPCPTIVYKNYNLTVWTKPPLENNRGTNILYKIQIIAMLAFRSVTQLPIPNIDVKNCLLLMNAIINLIGNYLLASTLFIG